MHNQSSNQSGFRFGRKRWYWYALIAIPAFALFVGAVMWLWNAILPDVTGWKPLTYWQALGLLVLCRILFGGFGRGRWRNGGGPQGRWRERWMNMSDEERAQLRERWRNRCRE